MNSAVVFALDAILARSAAWVGIAQIVVEALMQWTIRNACYARRALGAVLSELTISRPARTVQSEDIRQPLEFRKSRDAMHAVLADSLLF